MEVVVVYGHYIYILKDLYLKKTSAAPDQRVLTYLFRERLEKSVDTIAEIVDYPSSVITLILELHHLHHLPKDFFR